MAENLDIPTREVSSGFLAEVPLYIEAYRSSSDRVRLVFFVILVVTVLAFGGWLNSLHRGWLSQRLAQARVALNLEMYPGGRWERQATYELDDLPSSVRAMSTQRREEFVQAAAEMVRSKALGDRNQLENYLQAIEQSWVDQVIRLKVPLIAATFDINDLGVLASISLALLAIILMTSLAREHENLFLCMWKVKELCDHHERSGADCKEDRSSLANLLYHALAMAQLFSSPPTLVRWRKARVWHLLSLFLFSLPLVVVVLLFVHNVSTFGFGWRLNPTLTLTSLVLQGICAVVVLVSLWLSWLLLRAIRRLWVETFKYMNPTWSERSQKRWKSWLKAKPITRNEEVRARAREEEDKKGWGRDRVGKSATGSAE